MKKLKNASVSGSPSNTPMEIAVRLTDHDQYPPNRVNDDHLLLPYYGRFPDTCGHGMRYTIFIIPFTEGTHGKGHSP